MPESSAGVSRPQAVMPTGGYLEVVRGYGSPENWGPLAQASVPGVKLHAMLGVATEAYPNNTSYCAGCPALCIPGVAVNAYPCSVWGCQGIDVMPRADRCKP